MELTSESLAEMNNLRDVGRIRHLYTTLLDSPILLRYVHRKKYNITPPESVYLPEGEIPWRVEFSFLPQRFFPRIGDKTFFDYIGTHEDALIQNEIGAVIFLESLFPELMDISQEERERIILTSMDIDPSVDLSRKFINSLEEFNYPWLEIKHLFRDSYRELVLALVENGSYSLLLDYVKQTPHLFIAALEEILSNPPDDIVAIILREIYTSL